MGSGKTTTSVMEVIRHVIETPNGATLMGAATFPQLEQTSMKEFFERVPTKFIKHYSKQKNYVDMLNGHRVLFRPLDSEGKARSLNLTCFHIEEASEVNYDYFVQLQTRLRNTVTKNHLGILSSNPDISWIRNDFLLKSARIVGTETRYHQDPFEVNKQFSSHIAPTHLNKYLPPDFYEVTAKNKPNWWVERYLRGSFEFSEGQVYPELNQSIVEPFDIPKHWTRVFAADYGLRDATVMLGVAINPEDGIAYVYDEHYESGKPIPYHAEKMLKMMDGIPPGKILRVIGDPAGKRKSERDMRSIYDHYAEYGIYFEPGMNRIEDGIMKVFTYFMLGKLKIFSNLKNTIREGLNYKYKAQELDSAKNSDEKPEDKDNHTMDALRYAIQELPDDPNQLVNKSFGQSDVNYGNMESDNEIPFALQDEDDSYNGNSWASYY